MGKSVLQDLNLIHRNGIGDGVDTGCKVVASVGQVTVFTVKSLLKTRFLSARSMPHSDIFISGGGSSGFTILEISSHHLCA